ncbi:hypothetical protein KQX54_008842 [Cotesia glomerata]|uniref:Uncharacterized protein n=1 Tax=Cotesia glomerata TaxID=32391 RepID=A0AAV7ILW4_COTGL|nr:hypothetical protein KQX54_008842 [Cotesia glomerata]
MRFRLSEREKVLSVLFIAPAVPWPPGGWGGGKHKLALGFFTLASGSGYCSEFLAIPNSFETVLLHKLALLNYFPLEWIKWMLEERKLSEHVLIKRKSPKKMNNIQLMKGQFVRKNKW